MSFILPPKSGEVALSAFCVEHGRWSARGKESAAAFSSATEALPSREAKLAMRAPIEAAPEPANSAHGGVAAYTAGGTYMRQSQVWDSVAATQMRLSDELSTTVASPQSATSLQLALENEKLQKARDAYIKALQDRGTKEDDIVGYALAINGHVSSADVYPSNALFRKMWEKQLTAGVTEAIGDKTDATTATAPTPTASRNSWPRPRSRRRRSRWSMLCRAKRSAMRTNPSSWRRRAAAGPGCTATTWRSDAQR